MSSPSLISSPSSSLPSDQDELRMRWTELYTKTLPRLAKSRSNCQSHWPVFLDHCFARIILDNAVGKTRPWTSVVKAPAIKNMSIEEMQAAITLGNDIVNGKENLAELNKRSLRLRGKSSSQNTEIASSISSKRKAPVSSQTTGEPSTKLKRSRNAKGEAADMWSTYTALRGSEDDVIHSSFATSQLPLTQDNNLPGLTQDTDAVSVISESDIATPPQSQEFQSKSHGRLQSIQDDPVAMEAARAKIRNDKNLTPFRKHVLTLLTQVPRGRYTTYKALSAAAARLPIPDEFYPPGSKGDDLREKRMNGNGMGRGCARAIGGAMRDNPFAPTVPCHRVMAADGKIGGFKGDWGDEGRFVKEKRRLLQEEGVPFDGRGRVAGKVFEDYV